MKGYLKNERATDEAAFSGAVPPARLGADTPDGYPTATAARTSSSPAARNISSIEVETPTAISTWPWR